MTTLRLRMTPAALCLCLALACTALGYAILQQALPGLALAMGDWLPTFTTSQADRMALAVVQYSLLPRITMSILVGAALGLAGVLMQQVLRNSIASPTTLGVASGAQLGLLAATLYAPGLLVFGGEWVALAGGGLSLMLVLSLSWRQRLAPVAVVLSGLVVNLYLGALSTVLILFNQEDFRGLMIRAAGSMAQKRWEDTLHLLPRLLVAIALAALLARPLKLLELNESNARSLGASVRQLRLTGLGLSVFITASAVSLVGIVGFVGLAAPAIVRLMGAGSVSAFVTLAILILLNRRSGFQADRLLLSGIAIAALFDPLRSIFLANGDPRIQQMIAWMSGSTYYVDMSMGLSATAFAVIMMALTPLVARWLDLLPLGRATALGLGVGINRVRLALLAMVAVLTAFATLIVGPLSFAGLLAPHMARMLGLSRALPHLLGAAMIGAILMVSADWLGRQMLFPQEVPAGLVSALLGGAYFMWGLRRH